MFKSTIKTNRMLMLGIAFFCLAWPIAVDQKALGQIISPSGPGREIAFSLKIISLVAGGVLASLILVDSKKLNSLQLGTARIIVALLVSGLFFVITASTDFSRDYHF